MDLLPFDFYRRRNKDEVLLVDCMGENKRIVDRKYISSGEDNISWEAGGSSKKCKLKGGILNDSKQRTFLVDYHDGSLLSVGENDISVGAGEIDSYLKGGLINNFVSALEEKDRDLMLLIFGVLGGTGIGYIVNDLLSAYI